MDSSAYVVKEVIGGGISRDLALKFVGLYWAGALSEQPLFIYRSSCLSIPVIGITGLIDH